MLLGLGGAIAIGLPSTISDIENPAIRAGVQLVALIVVFGLGYLMQRTK